MKTPPKEFGGVFLWRFYGGELFSLILGRFLKSHRMILFDTFWSQRKTDMHIGFRIYFPERKQSNEWRVHRILFFIFIT